MITNDNWQKEIIRVIIIIASNVILVIFAWILEPNVETGEEVGSFCYRHPRFQQPLNLNRAFQGT